MREEIIDIGKRTCHIITTDSEPQCVLVKPLCSFERRLLLHECALIEQEAGKGFAMYTFEVEEAELWKDRVGELLAYIENSLIAAIKARYAHLPLVVGGYSLGGLFALWTTTKTPIFDAVAACSPSLWMQGWEEYYEAHPSKAKYIYMSLGDNQQNAVQTGGRHLPPSAPAPHSRGGGGPLPPTMARRRPLHRQRTPQSQRLRLVHHKNHSSHRFNRFNKKNLIQPRVEQML